MLSTSFHRRWRLERSTCPSTTHINWNCTAHMSYTTKNHKFQDSPWGEAPPHPRASSDCMCWVRSVDQRQVCVGPPWRSCSPQPGAAGALRALRGSEKLPLLLPRAFCSGLALVKYKSSMNMHEAITFIF